MKNLLGAAISVVSGVSLLLQPASFGRDLRPVLMPSGPVQVSQSSPISSVAPLVSSPTIAVPAMLPVASPVLLPVVFPTFMPVITPIVAPTMLPVTPSPTIIIYPSNPIIYPSNPISPP